MVYTQVMPSLLNQLIDAAEVGDLVQVNILAGKVDPRGEHSRALGIAAANGHYETVEALRPFSDEWANDYYALRSAADGGWLDCVKALATSAPPSALDKALMLSVNQGKTRTVDYLMGLPVSETTKNDCLISAISAGDAVLVETLLKHMDARGRESAAICQAIAEIDEAIVDLLWPVSDLHAQFDRPLAEAAKVAHTGWVNAIMPGADLDALGAHLMAQEDWDGINAMAPYVPTAIVGQWIGQLATEQQAQVPRLMSEQRSRAIQGVSAAPAAIRSSRPRA